MNLSIKKQHLMLLIFTITFVFIRLFILFNSDIFFHIEELYMGTVAKELIRGPKWPIFDYQENVYEARTLLSSIMIVPFFLIFGESVISMKLLGLTWGIITFVIFYLFLNKYFDYRIALLASLMYIFSPPPLIGVDLAAIFSGWFLYSVIVLSIFFNIFSYKINHEYFFVKEFTYKQKKISLMALGLLCGFFTYLHPIFFLAMLAYLFFLFILDKAFFFKCNFIYFIALFVIGYIPGIYYNITRNFAGLNIKGEPLFNFLDLNNLFANLKKLIINLNLLFQFHKNIFISHIFSSSFFYAVLILSYFYMAWKNRNAVFSLFKRLILIPRNKLFDSNISIESILLLYPFLFLLVFSLVNTKRGPQTGDYVLLYPFFFIMISSFIVGLFNKKKYVLSIIVLIVMFSVLSINISGLISFNKSNETRSKQTKPYLYEALAISLFAKYYWLDKARCMEYIDKIDTENKADCYKGIEYFFRIFYPKSEKDKWENIIKELNYETNPWGF